MFVLFFRESYPTEVVAIFGVSVFLVSGVLPYKEALNVLSNPAPWTIAAMFIVMGALVRTGALNAFTVFAEQQAKRDKKMYFGIIDRICGHCLRGRVQHACRSGHDPCICAAGPIA